MVEQDGFQIIHEHTYEYALTNLLTVSADMAEEAVGPVMYALNRNPEGFPVVLEPDVRMAKLVARPRSGLPPFRVFFRLQNDRHEIFLLYIDHGSTEETD